MKAIDFGHSTKVRFQNIYFANITAYTNRAPEISAYVIKDL